MPGLNGYLTVITGLRSFRVQQRAGLRRSGEVLFAGVELCDTLAAVRETWLEIESSRNQPNGSFQMGAVLMRAHSPLGAPADGILQCLIQCFLPSARLVNGRAVFCLLVVPHLFIGCAIFLYKPRW